MEYLQPDKFKERLNFDSMYQVSCFFFAGRCIMSPCISYWERPSFAFFPGQKKSCLQEKNPSFQIMQERSCAFMAPFGKAIFSEGLKKISYFRVFFKKDHLSFSVYFRGKRNIIFPDNTRKFIFQRNLLGKTIFSGRPEKRKYDFSCST